MAFSVTCAICGRQFVGIDDSLMGQRAKCKCGQSVTLDPVWDESDGRVQVVAKADDRKKAPSRKQNRLGKSKSAKAKPAARSASDSRKQSKPRRPRDLESKKSNDPKSQSQLKSRSQSRSQSRAEVPTESKSVQTKTATEQTQRVPATFDSFDMDEILAGGVDTSPLSPSPATPQTTASFSGSPAESPVELEGQTTRSFGSMGIVGSVLAGVSGFGSAALLLMTRFADFEGTPLGWIGQAFNGAHNGSFGSGEMSDRSVRLFVGSGWGLVLLGVLIGIVSLFLLGRVGFRIATGRRLFSWSRPALATLGVICLFSLMGLLFVQSVHHGELLDGLLDFAGEPLEGLLPDETKDEPFKEIRDQYNQENREFMVGVVSFAILPLMVFGGAIMSLFFDDQ